MMEPWTAGIAIIIIAAAAYFGLYAPWARAERAKKEARDIELSRMEALAEAEDKRRKRRKRDAEDQAYRDSDAMDHTPRINMDDTIPINPNIQCPESDCTTTSGIVSDKYRWRITYER